MHRRNRFERGNAIVETMIALLAFSPLLVGIPLLGKQLDVKHKTYDAVRYAVWERTAWRSSGTSNRKSQEEISLEARDRALGDPRSGLIPAASIVMEGVGENALWRDRSNRRLLDYESGLAPIQLGHDDRNAPAEVGYWLVPGVAYGAGFGAIAEALRVQDLGLDRRTFANTSVSVGLRSVLSEHASRASSLGLHTSVLRSQPQLIHRAGAAILSDSWSARDENTLRRRVDDVTTNELIEALERPGRLIGIQAVGKGRPLYGEGQYGWDPDLRPRSTVLPSAYIRER